jgi:hypothetical protein
MTDPNYELAKLITSFWIHLPQHEENINHPEFGRHTYIYGIAYESAQYNKCVAALLKELINQYSYNHLHIDGDHGLDVINVRHILKLIEELEG